MDDLLLQTPFYEDETALAELLERIRIAEEDLDYDDPIELDGIGRSMCYEPESWDDL